MSTDHELNAAQYVIGDFPSVKMTLMHGLSDYTRNFALTNRIARIVTLMYLVGH